MRSSRGFTTRREPCAGRGDDPCSWFFLHTLFAIQYAHQFYADPDEVPGLTFQVNRTPDYWDFMYFAFTIVAKRAADEARHSRHSLGVERPT